MARKPEEKAPAPEFKLPLFDLFGGQKAFKTDPKKSEGELPPPLPPVKQTAPPKGREF